MISPWSIAPGGQPIHAVDTIRANPPLYWYVAGGTTHVCGRPEPILRDVSIRFDGVQVWCRGFWQLSVQSGAAQKGHSGSLVCRTYQDRTVACGLLFAGFPDRLAFVYPMKPMFDRLFNSLP
jgi:hypothetical protein